MGNEVQSLRQRLEIPQPTAEIAAFNEAIIGQEEAVESFSRMLVSLRSGIKPIKPRPLDAKFLAGPSGVGKTEIVYRLAELLEGDPSARSKVIKLNGAEYKSKSEVARLIGSPPGYIGSEDPRWPGGTKPLLGQENLNVHKITFKDKSGQNRSVVIILVDEAEKADPAVHEAFLSILDHGNLDLANNTSADFRNAVVFFTSNIGNQQVEQLRAVAERETAAQGDIPDIFRSTVGEALAGAKATSTIDEAFKMAFPPEFRGRIKDLIIFRNLSEDAISKIVDFKIKDIENEFGQNGVPIKLELDANVRAWLIKHGYNPSEGARALEKLIGTSIRDQLILAHGGVGLDRKTIYIEQDEGTGNLAFYFNETPDLFEPSVPKLSDHARKQLQAALYSNYGQPGNTVEKQVEKFKGVRDELLKAGVVPSAEVIKNDPDIQDGVKRNFIRVFKDRGINNLITFFNAYNSGGLIIWKEVVTIPEIKEIAREQLVAAFIENGPCNPQIAYLLNLSGDISFERAQELYVQIKAVAKSSESR